jgi:hypothetical protein
MSDKRLSLNTKAMSKLEAGVSHNDRVLSFEEVISEISLFMKEIKPLIH